MSNKVISATMGLPQALLLLLLISLAASSHADPTTSTGTTAVGAASKEQRDEIMLDQQLKQAFESAQKTLDTYMEAKSKLLALSNDIIEAQPTLDAQIQEVTRLQEDVANQTQAVDERIRDINAQQVLALKAKVEVLHKRELERRALLERKEEVEQRRIEKRASKRQKLKERKQKLKDKKRRQKLKVKLQQKKKKRMAALLGKKTKQVIPEGALTKEDLKELVDIPALMEESDKKIEELFVAIVEEEVDALQGELEETVIEATTALQDLEDEEKKVATTAAGTAGKAEDCSGATLVDAVQLVQESLVKFSHDKVGMVDHLSKAHVVHHLTSENFVPPSHAYQSLEELWWFQYLPDDWEKGLDAMLPKGWRKWNTAIPDYLYHTLGMNGRAVTAPPEAILKPSLHPGSCWPMAGQSGQVTLRLPYPVKVKAVTLDHAPSLLFEDPTKRHSAPKKVRVFGFPPCWTKKEPAVGSSKQSDYLPDHRADSSSDDDDAEYYRGICDDGLDFDVSKPVVLHDFEYNLEGPSIQTFHIPLPDETEDEEEDDEEGSCSQDTGTCGGGLDGPDGILFSSPDRSDTIKEGMSAIRMEVTDNWGNKDYTCIYRFRIHGDAIDPNL